MSLLDARNAPAEALGATLQAQVDAAGHPTPPDNDKAVRRAKIRGSSDPADPWGDADWLACWEAGMTAGQASASLGRHRDAAWRWQRRSGLRWPRASRGTPAIVRGRRYPSLTAAAAAHGVTVQTLIGHLTKHGNLDRMGIGSAGNARGGGARRPITILGRTFQSRKAAAQALGTSPEYLGRLIRTGRADLITAKAMLAFGMADAAAFKARATAEGRLDRTVPATRRSATAWR